MAAARQRQRTADHDEQLQHASIVAGVGGKFNADEFWRRSPSRIRPVAREQSGPATQGGQARRSAERGAGPGHRVVLIASGIISSGAVGGGRSPASVQLIQVGLEAL
jgi:hypothetical protein